MKFEISNKARIYISGNPLKTGTHEVIVKEIIIDTTQENNLWEGTNTYMRVRFENDEGFFYQYFFYDIYESYDKNADEFSYYLAKHGFQRRHDSDFTDTTKYKTVQFDSDCYIINSENNQRIINKDKYSSDQLQYEMLYNSIFRYIRNDTLKKMFDENNGYYEYHADDYYGHFLNITENLDYDDRCVAYFHQMIGKRLNIKIADSTIRNYLTEADGENYSNEDDDDLDADDSIYSSPFEEKHETIEDILEELKNKEEGEALAEYENDRYLSEYQAKSDYFKNYFYEKRFKIIAYSRFEPEEVF